MEYFIAANKLAYCKKQKITRIGESILGQRKNHRLDHAAEFLHNHFPVSRRYLPEP
jgi:hypothetical protein